MAKPRYLTGPKGPCFLFSNKAKSNLKKYGVSFAEATSVFDDDKVGTIMAGIANRLEVKTSSLSD